MAEILIQNIAPDRPDLSRSQIDARLIGLDGVVAVQEDGHNWGPGETRQGWLNAGYPPEGYHWNFLLLKAPGVAVADIKAMLESHWVDLPTDDPEYEPNADPMDNRRKVFLREWALDLTDLNAQHRDTLATTGELTFTNWGSARRAIKSRVDGRDFPQNG